MRASFVLKPRLSEKAYALSQEPHTYVFQVPTSANKQAIANEVARQFDVTVLSVNTTNVVGKPKRTYLSRSGKFVKGVRSNFKKAYVVVKEGDTIPVFAADEERAEKEEKLTETLKKASDKAEKKTAKKTKKSDAEETK